MKGDGWEYTFRNYLTLDDLLDMPLPESPDERVDIKTLLVSNAKLLAKLSIEPKLSEEDIRKLPISVLKKIIDEVLTPLMEEIRGFFQ